MKPWIKRTLLSLFGASVLFGGLAACSHRPQWGGGNMTEAEQTEWRGKMVERVAGKLDLDAAQKARLATLADTLAQQRKTVMAGANPRDEFRQIIAGERFDRARAQTLIDQKSGALREASPAVIAAMGDFYDSLRPEQQAKVREYLSRGGHRHGWRG